MTAKNDDDLTPIIRVELKRADAAQMVASSRELRESDFVFALGPNTESIFRAATARRFADRVVLFQQGDAGDSLFFILNGSVRLFARKETEVVELGMARAGEFLGEAAVITGAKRELSATALGPVEVAEIPRSLLIVQTTVMRLLENVRDERKKALSDLTDFVNRW